MELGYQQTLSALCEKLRFGLHTVSFQQCWFYSLLLSMWIRFFILCLKVFCNPFLPVISLFLSYSTVRAAWSLLIACPSFAMDVSHFTFCEIVFWNFLLHLVGNHFWRRVFLLSPQNDAPFPFFLFFLVRPGFCCYSGFHCRCFLFFFLILKKAKLISLAPLSGNVDDRCLLFSNPLL